MVDQFASLFMYVTFMGQSCKNRMYIGYSKEIRRTRPGSVVTIESGILGPYPATLLAQHSYRLQGRVAVNQQLASTSR